MNWYWFKMHCDARTDRKLATLDYPLKWVWFCLMCLAGENEQRGYVPSMKPGLLAIEVASSDETLLQTTLERLIQLDILEPDEDGGYLFTHWDERQYDKPSDRPEAVKERVRRHREKQKAEKRPETPQSHADVQVKRDVTPLKRPETHREEEIKRREESKEKKINTIPAQAREAENSSSSSPSGPALVLMPSGLRQEHDLLSKIRQHATELLDKAKLSKAQLGTIERWFTLNKVGLTAETVEYAVDQAARYTAGDCLEYFFRVMERKIKNPDGDRPSRSGKHAPPSSENPNVPREWESWDRDEFGKFIPLSGNLETGRLPYDAASDEEVRELNSQKWVEYAEHKRRHKQGEPAK